MIPCPLWHQAQKNPNCIALIDGNRRLTFKEWDLEAEKWAIAIKESEIEKSVLLSTIPKDPITTAAQIFGAIRMGNPIVLQSDRDPIAVIKAQQNRLNMQPFPEAINPQPVNSNSPPIVNENAIATILFTSGSSGQSKAVCHSLASHMAAAKGSGDRTPFQQGDKWGLSLSLWHIGGLSILFRALESAGTICVIKKNNGLKEAIEKNELTHLSLVAVQLNTLLEENPEKGSLKAILVGGGPCSNALFTKSIQQELPVKMTYGMTELASQFCTQIHPNESSNAGPPLRHWMMKLSPSGEICAKGPALLLGYLTENGLSCALDSEGWFHTGDFGKIKHGVLFPQGRRDQQFVSGGENISPEEIEMAALEHSGCNQAIVVAVPHRQYGERPVLFYDGSISKGVLKKWLKKKLANFKQPDHIYPWPSEIPLLKPSRSALRQLALERQKQMNPSS